MAKNKAGAFDGVGSGWIPDDAEQKRRADALLWLLDGGGGHEDGIDGLAAMCLTSCGLIDFLSAYEEHLREKWGFNNIQ